MSGWAARGCCCGGGGVRGERGKGAQLLRRIPSARLPACLGPHAEQHVVVVVAALGLRDALADGMRPQEIKGRTRYWQHLYVMTA